LAPDGPDERYDREKDSAFVSGVMQSLNLSEGVVKDVEEEANEELEDSELEEEEEDPGRMSTCSSASRHPDKPASSSSDFTRAAVICLEVYFLITR
jgi:hypothetical protein